MSGTPAPNIEWEYFSQMQFLSDDVFGDNFYKFRNRYFVMQRGKEIMPGVTMNKSSMREMFAQGYKYVFNEGMKDEFYAKMKPFVNMVKAKDCLDLPETVEEYRLVDMTAQQAKVYKDMKTEYIAEIKGFISDDKNKQIINMYGIQMECISDVCDKTPMNREESTSFIVANIVLTKQMKLRQITSGFAIDENGVEVSIGSKNPKLDEMLSIVEECGKDQIIIWVEFKYEAKILSEALNKISGVSELHGGIPEPKRIDHVNDFLSGKNRFLIAHPKSAAHGLTFVNCRYEVFFSLSASWENYEQCRRRTLRMGQINNCVYFHLLTPDTVDTDMLAICQKKKTKQEVAESFLKGESYAN